MNEFERHVLHELGELKACAARTEANQETASHSLSALWGVVNGLRAAKVMCETAPEQTAIEKAKLPAISASIGGLVAAIVERFQ